MKICKEVDCNNKSSTRGWCQKHYARWRRGRPINMPDVPHRLKPPRFCEIEGCDRIHFGKGLCVNHYMNKRRRKNVM